MIFDRARKVLAHAMLWIMATAPLALHAQEDGRRNPSVSIEPISPPAPALRGASAPSAQKESAAAPRASSAGGQKIVVALDVGHTRAQPGAISAYGRTEYSYNKEVVDRIASRLERSERVKPFIVNPTGETISLRLRTELARKHGAQLFLSVHHDAAQPKYLKSWVVDGKPQSYSEDFRGYGVFVSGKNPLPKHSAIFGAVLGQEMRRAGFQFSPHHNEPIKGENRPIIDRENGLYRYDDLIVLKSARMPAALLECGVIIHPEEAKILAQSETQEKIAEAVGIAVERMATTAPWE